MAFLATALSEFILDLRAQKLRAFLTTFGIIWGTVAIIVLIAFGVGFKKQLAQNMHGIGELSDDMWRRVLSINLDGPMFTSRRAVPQMASQGGGSIISTASETWCA